MIVGVIVFGYKVEMDMNCWIYDFVGVFCVW